MEREKWENLEELFHAASEIEPQKRDAFLDRACVGNAALRLRIERMLAENPDDDSLLGKHAMNFVAGTPPPITSQTISSGTLLEHYQISGILGAGGMGTVYRARDLKLDRDVAIKVLPAEFSMDAERLQRFNREARLLASLSHAHIAAIFGLVESRDVRGLVLELVDGPTLDDRLATGPLPLDEALTVALQICEAVEAAHGQEIIHRDLKPSNIKLTLGGEVKVLDFGLAKALTQASSADTPTGLSFDGILSGQPRIVGTAPYMSPEQARGAAVGKGSDIWAFGCILYELITGRRAFRGETFSEIIVNVLEQEPEWEALPASTPESIQLLLRRCLKKDPARRLKHIGDARIEIEDALQPSRSASALVSMPGRSRSVLKRFAYPWLALIAVAVLSGVLVWSLRQPGTAMLADLSMLLPAEQFLPQLQGIAISPDSATVVYVGSVGRKQQLFLRPLGSHEAKALDNTDGASFPFFSPDGLWVGFFADGKIKKVAISGGPPVPILDDKSFRGFRGASWASDDTIYFSGPRGIWKVSVSGGATERVTTVDRSKDEIAHAWPQVLKDQNVLLYSMWTGPGWDEHQIVGLRLDTGEKQVVQEGAATGRYLPTGHLLYSRQGTLWAVRFDPARLQPSGTPIKVVDDLREATAGADYNVSLDGSLVYVRQPPGSLNRIPVLVDRKGNSRPLPGLAPAFYQHPSYSPDGQRIAFMITDSEIDIYVYDVARTTMTKITSGGESSQYPVWSPDGQFLAYRGNRAAGSRNLFMRSSDGTGDERQLTNSGRVATPRFWTSDPLAIAYTGGGNGTIFIQPLNGQSQRLPLADASNPKPRLSPNGALIAYISGQPGETELQVASRHDPPRRWPISTDGAQEAVWSPTGRELYYRNGQKMFVVDVDPAGPTFSTPRLLFEKNYVRGDITTDFDVAPGDLGFVMLQYVAPQSEAKELGILLHLGEDLQTRFTGLR